MRILLVGKAAPERGGIAAHLELLAVELARRHDVALCNLSRATTTTEGGRATWGNLRRTLADARRVWRLAADTDAVSIHSALNPLPTVVRAAVLVAVARLRGAGRVVLHAHGGGLRTWLQAPWQRWLVRALLRPAHLVVAVAEGERRALQRALGPGRVRLIENAIDDAPFQVPAAPHEPPRILYLGVLSPRKGLLDLLEAARLLQARGQEHELVLVGGTPGEGATAETTVRQAAAGLAEIRGPVDHEEIPALLASASLLCLPSWYEAMPLSVLEAMAAGLPVVATRVGDVPRMVEHGTTGLLVPPRDPVALADALQALLGDPAARSRMGAAGRRLQSQRFHAERMVAGVEGALGVVTSGRAA